MRFGALIGLLSVLGCAEPALPARAPSAPAPTPAPLPPPPAAPAAAVDPVPWQLQAGKRQESTAFVEIRFPYAEQRIPRAKASAYRVRLKHDEKGSDVERLFVALDDERPRAVSATEITLAELVPADGQLDEGAHWLTAFIADAQGRRLGGDKARSRASLAAVRFWVDGRDERQAPEPRLSLLSPGGTYNGSDAEVWIDASLSFVGERTLTDGGYRVSVAGGGRVGSLVLSELVPVVASDLGSGDFDVLVEVHLSDGTKLQQKRIITVNRDAPVPGAR